MRLTLQPGEERTVQVVLDSHQLAYHGADMQLAIQPGRREVMVGSSAADIRLEGSFTLTGPPCGGAADIPPADHPVLSRQMRDSKEMLLEKIL